MHTPFKSFFTNISASSFVTFFGIIASISNFLFTSLLISIIAFSYPCILWPITKYAFSLSNFSISSFSNSFPLSVITVSLPFELKLPPAIIIGTLSCGNFTIFSFKISAESISVFLPIEKALFLFFSISASSSCKIASFISLPFNHSSNFLLLILKYSSFLAIKSSSTFFIFAKSSSVKFNKFVRAICSSIQSVP